MKDLKVIFMGTPEFCVPVLQMLIENTNVILVVTQKDAYVGRHHELKYSPIKELAIKNNIEVYQPEKIRKEIDEIVKLNPDLIVTCAYGQIIPEEILNCTKYGCVNVHASLLPKLRGGAPIHHAIIDGYRETGITIMYMDKGMDSGDIISQESINIDNTMNTGELHDKLSLIGPTLLLKTLPDIINNNVKRIKQNEDEVTFGYTIKREDELINFNDTSLNIYNKVRGLYPWPLAYIILNDEETKITECIIGNNESNKKPGEIITINKKGLSVKTIDGEIIITRIKPFGKKEMSFCDFYNGLKDKTSLSIKNII